LNITNRGNSPRYYVIELHERQNLAIMLPSRVRIMVMPGQSVDVDIKVRAKRRPTLGRSRRCPIDIFIRTDGLRPQTKVFEYSIHPLITWELVAFAFVVASAMLFLLTHR
jgi:hypothetical protein